MRTTDFAFAAILAVSASSARAADLPAQVVTSSVPLFTWSGAHVGVFLDGGSGAASFPAARRASLSDTTAPTPFVAAGGQIGYDVQMPSSRVLLGVEADGGVLGGLDGPRPVSTL